MTHSTIILDGGLGRELARRNAPFRQPEWSALAMIEAPEVVQAVHEDFIRSGAQVITTNSYALVPFHIGDERFQTQGRELIARAGQVAKAATIGTQVKVAGSIPPLFGSYRPDLFIASKAAQIALPLIENLQAYADIWLLETQSLLAETQTVLDLLPQDNKPRWVSFSLDEHSSSPSVRLRSYELVEDAVRVMVKRGDVDAILFNCCQVEVILAALKITHQVLTEYKVAQRIRIGGYANAFVECQDSESATANEGISQMRQDLNTERYLDFAKQWHLAGASIIGGCCGIGPEYIAVLADAFAKR